jgi:hypothetical protein
MIARVPSLAGSLRTPEVGYFHAEADAVARWLSEGLGGEHAIQRLHASSADEIAALIRPGGPLTRRIAVPFGAWTMMVTDGPNGTDLGMLPSLAARELRCTAVRAVCVVDGSEIYPARILEVFGPEGKPPLLSIRSIAAANDGGSWIFETNGEPLPFEDHQAYDAKRKSERFSPDLLLSYLAALGVPVDAEPDWERALAIQPRSLMH